MVFLLFVMFLSGQKHSKKNHKNIQFLISLCKSPNTEIELYDTKLRIYAILGREITTMRLKLQTNTQLRQVY